MVYCCAECGSPFVEIEARVDPYTYPVVELIKPLHGYCGDCAKRVKVEVSDISFENYLENYEASKTESNL